MVIKISARSKQRGLLMADLAIAMAILVIAVLPLAYTAIADAKDARTTYQKAVVMEIVDGEMEILAAGAWRDLPEGTHPYVVTAHSATNLPKGDFTLSRTGQHLRLAWAPSKKCGVAPLIREVTVK